MTSPSLHDLTPPSMWIRNELRVAVEGRAGGKVRNGARNEEAGQFDNGPCSPRVMLMHTSASLIN